MSYLTLKNVGKEFIVGDIKIEALKNVSFDLDNGEFVIILGPSGAGKTTLLNILGGMDSLSYGEISVDGRSLNSLNRKGLTKYRRDDVGFVFQFYNLMPNLTALENVELATEICDDSLSPMEILKLVGLEERINNFPSQLSGGEQQRVSIARAIVNGPPLLIADEPTGNLDPKNSMEIMQILEQINQKGITNLVSTHDHAMVDYFRKRVITLDNGQVVKDVQAGTYDG